MLPRSDSVDSFIEGDCGVLPHETFDHLPTKNSSPTSSPSNAKSPAQIAQERIGTHDDFWFYTLCLAFGLEVSFPSKSDRRNSEIEPIFHPSNSKSSEKENANNLGSRRSSTNSILSSLGGTHSSVGSHSTIGHPSTHSSAVSSSSTPRSNISRTNSTPSSAITTSQPKKPRVVIPRVAVSSSGTPPSTTPSSFDPDGRVVAPPTSNPGPQARRSSSKALELNVVVPCLDLKPLQQQPVNQDPFPGSNPRPTAAKSILKVIMATTPTTTSVSSPRATMVPPQCLRKSNTTIDLSSLSTIPVGTSGCPTASPRGKTSPPVAAGPPSTPRRGAGGGSRSPLPTTPPRAPPALSSIPVPANNIPRRGTAPSTSPPRAAVTAGSGPVNQNGGSQKLGSPLGNAVLRSTSAFNFASLAIPPRPANSSQPVAHANVPLSARSERGGNIAVAPQPDLTKFKFPPAPTAPKVVPQTRSGYSSQPTSNGHSKGFGITPSPSQPSLYSSSHRFSHHAMAAASPVGNML